MKKSENNSSQRKTIQVESDPKGIQIIMCYHGQILK